MPFKKGQKKTGGRVKGVPNKTTLAKMASIDALCDDIGANPFEILARLCNDSDPHVSLQACKELAQYLKPKKRAIDLNGEVKLPIHVDDPIVLEIKKTFSDAEKGE